MNAQSLNYFSMAQRFLELKMGMEWQWAWLGMVWEEARDSRGTLISCLGRDTCSGWSTLSVHFPYFLFSYQIVQDEGHATTLFHSNFPIRIDCSSEMWAIYETPCLFPALSGSPLCSLQHDQQKALQMSAPGSNLPPAPGSKTLNCSLPRFHHETIPLRYPLSVTVSCDYNNLPTRMTISRCLCLKGHLVFVWLKRHCHP